MAVAAADFYTYARATGTPLPKSKQEEAQIAPAVDKWKKTRLKETNNVEQDNTGRNLGAAALGIGGAALAYGVGRRFGRGKGSNPVSKPPQVSPDLLPNVDNVTGLADTTFIPSPITPQDTRGVNLTGIRNPKTGTYRAAVNEIQTEAPSPSRSPSFETKVQNTAADEALWDSNYWSNFHTLRKADPSLDLAEVDRRAVLAAKKATNQPIQKDYTPGPATDHRIELQNIPESSPVTFSPRSYVESTGRVEPNTKQYDYQAGPMPPKIDPEDVVEQVDGVTSFNPWAADHEEIFREQAVDIASGKIPGGVIDKSRDPVSGYSYKDIQNKLLEQAETKKQSGGMRRAPDGTLYDPTTGMTWDDVAFNAGWEGRQPDTLVAKQNLNDPALSIQSSEAVDTGLDQVRQRIDTEVQRDTDSIALGKSAVKTEVLQEDLLEQAAINKAQAAGLIAARRTQLEQAGLTPGTTKFDNALARTWASRSDVDPNITSERFRENIVLPKDVEEFVSTKIPESDASNVAKNYYNQDTGNIEFATEEGGSPLIRDIYKERVVPSEDLSKAASGTSIRGTSRSLDIAEPKVRTRTDEFTGDERPDRIGGTLPIGGVPHVIKVDGMNQKSIQTPPGVKLTENVYGPLPAGSINAPQLSKQEVVHSITQSTPTWLTGNAGLVNREDVTGGGAGMGVYGRQSGYVPGPTSATAGTKPTQLPEGRYGEFNPTTSRDEFRDYSNEALQRRIDTGTYRSGKVSQGAREAQKELTLRKNLKYPVDYKPSKETTINAMKVSDDIRKIYNSGRPNAQQLVDEYKANLRNNLGI